MVYTPDSPHPQHPHHLECPRCSKHTVVVQGESRYACLNCNWWRDLNNNIQWDDLPILFATIMATLVILVALLPNSPPPPEQMVPLLPEEEQPPGFYNSPSVG